MTDDAVRNWVQNYRKAWESNDPHDIRALFTEDAAYHAVPSHQPGWVGHDEILEGWTKHQDAPGSTTFEWERVAVEGGTAVVRATTAYPDGPKAGIYDNVWIIELADDGRATSFTDFWVARGQH